jgi:two-component system sensor histidine kinase/response regulator
MAQPHVRHDRILVFESDQSEPAIARRSLEHQLPSAVVIHAPTLQQYRALLAEDDFDLVILDCDISGVNEIELIHELKLKDYEPAVMAVSSTTDPRVVADVYSSGCHKYLVKDQNWGDEVGQAARHLLRIRRLEEENRRLLGRLTEANKLLEEKNTRLDEFSATVAHDIRGPLGGVSMKLDYILESYGDELNQRCVDLLEGAFEATQRLTDLVQAMYDFARLGSKATRMAEVDLEALVKDIVTDMHVDSSLEITVGIGDLPPVWGCESLLRRVFINLISNAVKYCEKTDIVLNVGLEQVVETSIAQFCEVFVEDNGPGIPKEELANIFRIFSRGEHAAKSSDGLGIGLSVVERVMELHYGSVRVESRVGEGTRFILRLPMEKIDFLG